MVWLRGYERRFIRDLSAGGGNAKAEARVAELGFTDFKYRSAPTLFWDVFGEKTPAATN